MGGELSGPTTGAAAAAPSAVPATMAVIMTRKILTSIIALLGFSAVAYAQSSLPKRQVFHGVVTNWEHVGEQHCAYVQMAGGRWYGTRIILALDGFATLQALGESKRHKTLIAFTVLPPISECGPFPGIRVWVTASSPGRRR